MLAGEMTNADEDEVEDELDALQKGMELERGAEREDEEDAVKYPAAPVTEPASAQERQDVGTKEARERARASERRVALATDQYMVA